MSKANQNEGAFTNTSERAGRPSRFAQNAQGALPARLSTWLNPIATREKPAMLSNIIALDYAPDNEAADEVLADIVADVQAMRLPSVNKLNLYAQLRLSAHKEALGNSKASLATDEEAFDAAFKKLRAMVGDPVPLETDAQEDVIDHLEDRSINPND